MNIYNNLHHWLFYWIFSWKKSYWYKLSWDNIIFRLLFFRKKDVFFQLNLNLRQVFILKIILRLEYWIYIFCWKTCHFVRIVFEFIFFTFFRGGWSDQFRITLSGAIRRLYGQYFAYEDDTSPMWPTRHLCGRHFPYRDDTPPMRTISRLCKVCCKPHLHRRYLICQGPDLLPRLERSDQLACINLYSIFHPIFFSK